MAHCRYYTRIGQIAVACKMIFVQRTIPFRTLYNRVHVTFTTCIYCILINSYYIIQIYTIILSYYILDLCIVNLKQNRLKIKS